MEAKPLLRPHLKSLREQGVVLTETKDIKDKSMEEIMDMVVSQLYSEDEVNKLSGGEMIALGGKCVEMTFGDQIEKK